MNPRTGMFAMVRNRPAVISMVQPWSGADQITTHLVDVQYKDGRQPWSDKVIWEREVDAIPVESSQLPRFDGDAMNPDDFDAMVRSARWEALLPFSEALDDRTHVRDVYAPFFGAVQVEEYQLVPLYKALQMPRINLLVADDVGLGKTVEAGLIITELLRRRRVQRVLVLCPASLRLQWRDEMRDKFSLDFDVVDRDSTDAMRRELGPDANPWRSSNRIVASYHYLRQPDIQEQFHASAEAQKQAGPLSRLPWDLLIVDECHHLMPAPLGQDSDLCEMLRRLSPLCEHRIFLSATPHNGHTRSFTGLLEMLDPVQFTRSNRMRDAERSRLSQVVVRRLKSEINERTQPPRFCHRESPQALDLAMGPMELELHEAFEAFRYKVRSVIAIERSQGRTRAGWFAVEILGKRLLSCPTAFAESWFRYLEGMEKGESAEERAVLAARKAVDQESDNDRETNARETAAAAVVGAWLRSFTTDLQSEVARITAALVELGYQPGFTVDEIVPREDSRFQQLENLIRTRLRSGKDWVSDERLVVFTEFKTTLDYLKARLRKVFKAENQLDCLFGGMVDVDRERVKTLFNDPHSELRILLATDAASEGLNLQRSARLLLHWDCPWNPSRIEQRNGRLDRHGQPRTVQTFHFASQVNADLRFLALLVSKVDKIRSDLGSMAEILDRAVHQGLVEGRDLSLVDKQLDNEIASRRNHAHFEADSSVSLEEARLREASLEESCHAIDLDASAMRGVLEAAIGLGAGEARLVPGEPGLWDLPARMRGDWKQAADSIRRSDSAMRHLAFDAQPFLEQVGERSVFAPRPDAVLMHLGHPLVRRSILSVGGRRFPTGRKSSRWTVRQGGVPAGADALVIITLEEIASNDLHETFHHWVRTLGIPVVGKSLGKVREIESPFNERSTSRLLSLPDSWRDRMDDLELDLRAVVSRHLASIEERLRRDLQTVRARRESEIRERLQSRQGELSTLIEGTTRTGLERELLELQTEIEKRETQLSLFEDERTSDLRELRQNQARLEEELSRRKTRLGDLRDLMGQERVRILDNLLPKRYSLAGSASVLPVAVELRLPEGVLA